MWTLIDEEISRALGETFTTLHRRSLGGGCINEAFHLEGRSRSLFVKLNSAARLAMFTAEAAGLEAIRASKALRAPRPIAWGTAGQRSWLALEFIPFSASGHRGGALLGEQLAAMHRSSAQAFGWERNNTIGATPQPNPWTADWAGFFRDQRLGYQLRLARENGLPEGSLERAARWRRHPGSAAAATARGSTGAAEEPQADSVAAARRSLGRELGSGRRWQSGDFRPGGVLRRPRG